MDTAIVVNTILAVSALLVSGAIAIRQLLTARRANYLAMSLQLLKETTTAKFLDDEEYIVQRLAVDHEARCGISNLPAETRTRVWQVAYLYQTIGYLAALRAVDRRTVRYLVGVRAVSVWRSLAPFVAREREVNAAGVGFRFFEDLAAHCSELSAVETVNHFRLRSFAGPSLDVATPRSAPSSPELDRGGGDVPLGS